MTALPWYKFYPGDYARDTADLTMLEDAAYRRLLDAYFCNRKLPSDLLRLQRIARASTQEEKAAVDFVVKRFFRADGERLLNGRAEREIEARDAYFAEQTRKAKLGGRPAKAGENPGDTPGETRGIPRGGSHSDLDLDPDLEERKKEQGGSPRGDFDAPSAPPRGHGATAEKGDGEDRHARTIAALEEIVDERKRADLAALIARTKENGGDVRNMLVKQHVAPDVAARIAASLREGPT